MNTITIKPITLPRLLNDNSYEYLLCISSDGLYIFNSERTKIIETIVLGVSDEGFLCTAPDLNTFLDAITFIKEILLNGDNPLKYI
jgi:hypothetical protein